MLWDSVKEKAQAQADAAKCKEATGESTHFGDLMTLCHEKHAELFKPEDEKVYKGRIVFRGDNVKDEEGYLAVFCEQGTSASHLEAAKMMDALARSYYDEGECDGEEVDAIGAYTQASLAGEQTWISIPYEYWPKHWKGRYTKPVVP